MSKFINLLKSLKSLPSYAFAFLLGAAMVVTAFAAAFTTLLWVRPWSPAVEPIVATGFATALYISLGALVFVIFVLAFGKIEHLSVTAPSGITAELDFDKDDDK